MNYLPAKTLREANTAAVCTLALSFFQRALPERGETLRAYALRLSVAFSEDSKDWGAREQYRLRILQNAARRSIALALLEVQDLTYSQSGLTACVFAAPAGDVYVAFRGTGSGEWIDNGEGLDGIGEENTYIVYDENGLPLAHETVVDDQATDQQVQALNWFSQIAAKNGWDRQTGIVLAGHSKGGNKAQFIAVHTDLPRACYSFNGQGFSPEALADLKARLGADYELRRQNIYSFSADNDYVNVLGDRLMPENQVYFFASGMGLHYLEAMLDENGAFWPQTRQGRLSEYVESVSRELMQTPPAIRQYAALGIMNVFQRYLGAGEPVNGDKVSIEKTVAGIGVAIRTLLQHPKEN